MMGTRLAILLLGAIAVTIVGTIPAPTAEALWRVSSNELVNLQARWDTDFYHQIATVGYRWDPSVFLHQNVVFFPLYPLLMRWAGGRRGALRCLPEPSFRLPPLAARSPLCIGLPFSSW